MATRAFSKIALVSSLTVMFMAFQNCAPMTGQAPVAGGNSDQGDGDVAVSTTTTSTSTTTTTQPIVASDFKTVGHKVESFGFYKDDFGAVVKEQGVPVPIHASIWYPTDAAGVQYTYKLSADGSGQGIVSEDVLLDGPIAKGLFPVVLFAHGDMGCGAQGIFITEQLARRGYIVIAPDYNDANCSEAAAILKTTPMKISAVCPSASGAACFTGIDPGLSFSAAGKTTYLSWRYRYFESKDALDWVLSATSGFAESIQRDAKNEYVIAGMGYSLGGYTIQNMVGAWPSWSDKRIKSAVLLSPWVLDKLPSRIDSRTGQKEAVGNPNNWLADPMNTLSSKNLLTDYIDVPVFYQGGDADLTITPWVCALADGVCTWGNSEGFPTSVYPDGGITYLTNGINPVKKDTFFALFAGGVGHLAWSNSQCSSYATTQACLSSNVTAKNMNFFALRFLETYSKGLVISDLLTGYNIGADQMPVYFYKKQGDNKVINLR